MQRVDLFGVFLTVTNDVLDAAQQIEFRAPATSVVSGGVGCVLAVLWIWLRTPNLLHYRKSGQRGVGTYLGQTLTTNSGAIEVELCGHLTLDQLHSKLVAAEAAVARLSPKPHLIVDCRAMDGYDVAARTFFVEWNAKMRDRLGKLAVLTERQMWHLVVSGMALASRRQMRAFSTREDALAWLGC